MRRSGLYATLFFAQQKTAGAVMRNFAQQNCAAALLASEFAEHKFAVRLLRAQGIAAESPQDLHWQIRGLGAESPVFCGRGICAANSPTAKNAPTR
jgi:hypothetical protein